MKKKYLKQPNTFVCVCDLVPFSKIYVHVICVVQWNVIGIVEFKTNQTRPKKLKLDLNSISKSAPIWHLRKMNIIVENTDAKVEPACGWVRVKSSEYLPSNQWSEIVCRKQTIARPSEIL